MTLTSIVLRTALFIAGLSAFSSASAEVFETLEDLNQSQFKELSKELGAATHYKSIAPPETLDSLGVDVGIEISGTDISGDTYDLASDGDFAGSDLIIPRVHVHKGLPFGVDLGASVGVIPDSDAKILGAEVRYAIIDGGTLKPALGIRATYSMVTGIENLDVKNYGVELGVSKGFLFMTPYAGVGFVRTDANPDNVGLSSESHNETKFFVGATANFGVALTLEADFTGEVRTYSAKAGIRF